MTGNSTENGYSRRREDRQRIGIKRNLDWQTLPSDIELFEQSPLVIAGALATPDGTLRLTPATSSSAHPGNPNDFEEHEGGNVTSIQSLQSRKEQGGHSNLLTRHTVKELRERCKKLAVRHALVKKAGEQRLYLAVGMLEWSPLAEQIVTLEDSADLSSESAKANMSSPLLFYPVHLLTEDNAQSESGFVHMIRNDCEQPEFNYQLANELRNQRGITLPVYRVSQTLAEYIELIGKCIEGYEHIKLAPRLALGLAKAPAGITSKTQNSTLNSDNLPGEFDVALAQDIVQGMDMQELRTTLRLLTAANDIALISDESGSELPDTPELNEVHEYSVLLNSHGLGNTRFQDLPELPEQIEEWCESIEPVAAGALFTEVLEQPDVQAVSLLKIAGMLELLDRAPSDIESWVHADLAYSGTPLLFKRAKYQSRLIEEELGHLKEHFHLDRVPPKHQLLQLLDELSGDDGQQIEVVDSDYFHARRRFMELSMDKPTTLTDFHKRQLNKLVKVLRFRELFVNNSEYRLALGPAYRGLRTDWDALERNIDYAQEISDYICSEEIAAKILNTWKEFNREIIATLDDLQIAGKNLHRLLQLCRRDDANGTISEVMRRMRQTATLIQQWNNEYGLITNFGDKSPAMLLEILAGKNVLDPQTELHVNNTKGKIHQFLLANRDKTSTLRVQGTLNWLSEASTNDTATMEVIEAVLKDAQDGAQPDQVIS